MRIPCRVCGIDSWSQVEYSQHTDCRAIDDRRQRAIEAFDDRMSAPRDVTAHRILEREGWAERTMAARDEAVRTATQVMITDDIVRAVSFARQTDAGNLAKAAFRAAGFEVVE